LIDHFADARAPLQHALGLLLILPEILGGEGLFDLLQFLLFLLYFKDNL
jgi:hypothetical protein